MTKNKRSNYTVSATQIAASLDPIKDEVGSSILELRAVLVNLNSVDETDKRKTTETFIQSLHRIGLVANRLRNVAI